MNKKKQMNRPIDQKYQEEETSSGTFSCILLAVNYSELSKYRFFMVYFVQIRHGGRDWRMLGPRHTGTL